MKHWIKLTDDYANKIKADSVRRKIRLPWGTEVWAYWGGLEERCFYWNQGEDCAYMDEPDNCPTHILVG